ncbi:MAG TPA: pilus assembly protein TadG-related protein, partial [Acidiphilium sp.]
MTLCRIVFRWIKQIARHLGERRAAVAIIVALAAPVLIGCSALAIDVGFWYGTHEALQTASDAGALAAARFGSTDPAALATAAMAAANAATGNSFNFAPGSPDFTVSMEPTPTGETITVAASAPGDKFLSSIFYAGTPILRASAVAVVRTSTTPPPTATCFSSSSYTYVTPNGNGVAFTHVAGVDPVRCGDTALIQPLTNLSRGQSGTVEDLPIRLNDNGGALPAQGLAANQPSSTPGCSASYDPASPTADPGQPVSAMVNGVQTFFGPATVVQQGGGWGGGGWGGGGGWNGGGQQQT